MEHPDFGTICECVCHRDGSQWMHFEACCEWYGHQYISADGVVDVARFGALVMARRLAAQGKDGRKRVPPLTKLVLPRIKGVERWPDLGGKEEP